MAYLTIALHACATDDPCALCGKSTLPCAGPRLRLAERCAPVCRPCGKQHAPSLVALLDLAQVAERVGRIGRHTLVPPMGALLDLARAAESYTETAPVTLKQAA
jgi:hypothetical protein